jgi:hypothetical protein
VESRQIQRTVGRFRGQLVGSEENFYTIHQFALAINGRISGQPEKNNEKTQFRLSAVSMCKQGVMKRNHE